MTDDHQRHHAHRAPSRNPDHQRSESRPGDRPRSRVAHAPNGSPPVATRTEAEAIEVLRQVDTLVVDKTGTLTEGRPALATVVAHGEMKEAKLLRLTAALERVSEHPLAAAIVQGASERGLELPSAVQFEAVIGKGVHAIGNALRLRGAAV